MDFLGIFVVLNNVTNIRFFGVGIDSSCGIAGILKMYQGGIGQGFSVQSRPTQPIEACVEKETKQDGNNVRGMRNKIYTETEMKNVGNKRTNTVDGSCTIWFRGKPTLPNRFVNGIRNVVMGQHGHDLTILVPSIPPYLVQGRLVFGFRQVGIDDGPPGQQTIFRGVSIDHKLSALNALIGILVGKEPNPWNIVQPFRLSGNVVFDLEVSKHVGERIPDNVVDV